MHEHRLRVYYEDTDLAGIVYYANYLRFIERGRTEALLAAGVDQARLKAETGIVFAVRRVEIDYLRPALFQDELTVTTALVEMGGTRATLDQQVRRGAETLARARVVIVAIDAKGRPARLPGEMRAAMEGLAGPRDGG